MNPPPHFVVRLLVAVAVGLVLGSLAARVVLVGSGLSLVPWAVIGCLLGILAPSAREASRLGAAYGFSLTVAFMGFSYDGHAAVAAVAALDVGLALVGAVCGGLLAAAAASGRRRIQRAGR